MKMLRVGCGHAKFWEFFQILLKFTKNVGKMGEVNRSWKWVEVLQGVL